MTKTCFRMDNILQSPHRSPFDLRRQYGSSVSLPHSWLSVSNTTTARFNRWSLISLIVLATASALASPTPNFTRESENVEAREPRDLQSSKEPFHRPPRHSYPHPFYLVLGTAIYVRFGLLWPFLHTSVCWYSPDH